MRAIIVDDEPDAILTLSLVIKEYIPELNIVGQFMEPFEAIKNIELLKPDILFLDINMPEMNGFELLLNIEKKDFHIVFISAYDEYAINAFKYNAIDYLLKPVDVAELIETIKRIRERNLPRKVELKKIIGEINRRKDDKISISANDGIYFLKPSEIIYLQASGPNTKVIRFKGDIIVVSKSLNDIESDFANDFLRVHNSCLVNLKYVKMLQKGIGWSLLMENGDQIPIARNKQNTISGIISRIAN